MYAYKVESASIFSLVAYVDEFARKFRSLTKCSSTEGSYGDDLVFEQRGIKSIMQFLLSGLQINSVDEPILCLTI
jgi:hypothetical protein